MTFAGRIEEKFKNFKVDSDGKILKLPFENISHHLDTEFFFNNLTLMSSNEGIVIINDRIFLIIKRVMQLYKNCKQRSKVFLELQIKI